MYSLAVTERTAAPTTSGSDVRTAPSASDHVDLHYVCLVKIEGDNKLWELDGRRKGPLERGLVGQEDDAMSEKTAGASDDLKCGGHGKDREDTSRMEEVALYQPKTNKALV